MMKFAFKNDEFCIKNDEWDKIDGGQCTHAWALLTGCREQYTIQMDGDKYLLRSICIHNLDPESCGQCGTDVVYILNGVGTSVSGRSIRTRRSGRRLLTHHMKDSEVIGNCNRNATRQLVLGIFD